jgi:hypothetical protein
VVADNGSFSSPQSQNFIYSRTFTTPGELFYHCSVHSVPGASIASAMNGRINVVGTAAGTPINRGMSGAWFEPATSGQGMLLDVDPATRLVFVAWFTYERSGATVAGKVGAPDHRWLSAQGTYEGASVQMPLFRTTGGLFDQVQATSTTEVGTLTLEFASCTSATATYSLPGESLSGTIALQRVIPGSEADCVARTSLPPQSVPATAE